MIQVQTELMVADNTRTIRSAGFFLSGLFPLGTGPELPENFDETLSRPPINISDDKVLKHGKDAFPLNY